MVCRKEHQLRHINVTIAKQIFILTCGSQVWHSGLFPASGVSQLCILDLFHKFEHPF